MLREISLFAAQGKTMHGSAYSISCNQAVLVFTDGTFATICAVSDPQGGPGAIEDATLNVLGFGDEALKALRILTDDELERIRAIRHADYYQSQERRERALLISLLAKYGLPTDM